MMKRIISVFAAVCAMILILSLSAAAAAESGQCGDSLTWTLDENGLLTISGTGEMTSFPDVTESAVTDVRIGAGVTEICRDAVTMFLGFPNLKSIDVEAGNTVYASRDGVLFTQDLKTLLRYPSAKEGAYTVPDGVNAIDNGAFLFGDLTEITIPNGVTFLGAYAFNFCNNLTEIEIPAGVTGINRETFEGCENLVSVRIPEGVTYIDWCAFLECRKLKNISLPSSLVTIGESAFAYCVSLTDVIIPSGVKDICNYAFYHIPGLTEIMIPESVTTVGTSAFELEGRDKENLTVYCFSGTKGEQYADQYGHPKVLLDGMNVPATITSQPQDLSWTFGETAEHKLTVTAKADENHTLSWQWYINTAAKTEGGTAIGGATNATFSLPSDLSAGTYYYYCTVTSMVNHTPLSASVNSRVATVTVLNKEILSGDINADGVTDGRDAIRLMKYLAGEIDPETGRIYAIDETAADLNDDGKVNELDLLKLMKMLADA